MIHITAAIGLALAFLLEGMFWSVAPIAAAMVGVVALGGLALVAGVRALRRAKPRGPE